ncbi:hypothetical protein GQ55_7G101400 [Panicum hallii var. hallii]|uniref:Response regulatory domain-containing protein n=1 Tax=Panicum hallii var. hallii TaxID=1504633 RepID=A0A2T7CTL7_9POAL|nr:hypothetical protein GQ55_7G101400 [Panicum hallii var. hallii]
MDERAKLCPANGLSVIVVDEDKHHANSTRSMLCTLNYHATAYTSPIKALEFLEGHAQEVDLALVAVHMEELHGFQFLDIVRDAHKNVQVIMMSNETTMDTMKRCIKLGARFLVNKPIDAHTINNLWQHLDLKDYSRMDYIKNLLQGNGEAHDLSYLKENTKTKKGYICWNEYLHRKFLRALEILGEGAASPRNIEILMNVEGVNRKHIASHLQDEDMPHAQTGSFSDNNNAHAAMQRSIQFGTMYDESEYFYYSSGDEATEDGVDMMEDDGTSASSFTAQVSTAETFSAEGTKDILNNNSSKKQDRHGDKVGKAIKLVDYSESEDDEI